jgi:aminoglycoside phosphotransferase (APT) family kinase protein
VLDRSSPEQVRQAARMLATLHQVRPGLEAADGDALPGADNAVAAAELFPDHELDEWLNHWQDRIASAACPGWRHGDFFEQNILCRDGAVVGLVDWDDISIGPTDVELAWATWEFGKSARGDRLEPHSAAVFLDEYRRAGGPVTPLGDLVPLIRERLRRDIAFFRRIAASHGFAIDVADEASKIHAFRSLSGLQL